MDSVSKPVCIVLKAPSKNVEDQIVNCFANWTVGQLKQYLSQIYPSKPAVQDLKLIYSGQLLRDHLELKDVLHQYGVNETHIMHLVCMPPRKSSVVLYDNCTSAPSIEPTLQGNLGPPSILATSGVPAAQVQQPATTLNATGHLNTTNFTGYAAFLGAYPSMPHVPDMTSTPEQITQHMLWVHQMYTQFAIQYIQYIHSGNVMALPASTETGGNEHLSQNQPELLDENNVQAQQVHINGELANGLAHQDWLDYVYMVLCISMFLTIIFLFSTPTRIFSVILMIIVLYICQTDWFRAPLFPSKEKKKHSTKNDTTNSDSQQQDTLPDQKAAIPALGAASTLLESKVCSVQGRSSLDTPIPAGSSVTYQEAVSADTQVENFSDNTSESVSLPQPVNAGYLPYFVTVGNFFVGFFASLMPLQPVEVN